MKIRIQVFEKDSLQPVRNLPLTVDLSFRREPNDERGRQTLSAGLLATDRNGYVSFFFSCRPQLEDLSDAVIYRPGRRAEAVSLMDFLEFRDESRVFEYLVPREYAEARPALTGLTAVQRPDRIDFQRSPLSLQGASLTFGNFDCEKLIPQHVQEHCFYLHQVARVTGGDLVVPAVVEGKDDAPAYRAKLLKYQVCYDWLGYSMGKLVESMTLAPCESVTVAMKEWNLSAESSASQDESFSDQVSSQLSRERMIHETLNSSIREFGIGASFAGGVQKSSSVSASFNPIKKLSASIASGMKAFFGGSISANYNSRKLAATTTSRLNEQIGYQASRVMSNSVLAVQKVSQNETEQIVTRKIHNPNHCHTQTVNYYEVVDNYDVETQCISERDALLFKYSVDPFTKEKIFCHRHLFRGALLDPQLEDCLSTLGKVTHCCEQEDGSTGGGDCVLVKTITAQMTIGNNRTGSLIKLVLRVNGNLVEKLFPRSGSRYESGDTYTVTIPLGDVCVTDITEVGLKNDPDNITDTAFNISGLSISYTSPDFSGSKSFFQKGSHGEVNRNETDWLGAPQPALPDSQPTEAEVSLCSKMDNCCSDQLLAHFNCNQLYYNKILWLNEDPDQIAMRLDCYEYNGVSLLDLLNPEPIAVQGDWVAFEIANSNEVPLSPCAIDNRVVSLPTGGMFAESLLGSCNSCEDVDQQILENHKEYPCGCGCAGPEISLSSGGTPVTPVSVKPGLAGATNVIGIQTAPDAPGNALSGLFAAFANPNFSDASTLESLASFFGTLADAASGDDGSGGDDDGDDGGSGDDGGDDGGSGDDGGDDGGGDS